MKYFDYAATTPLDPEAAEIYVKAATEFYGNTGSLHDIGTLANDLLENCRQEFANMLGIEREGIFFTSGGTESNFLAIQALLSVKKNVKKPHIISTMAEHSSVQSILKKLEQDGCEVTLLPINKEGRVDVEEVKKATKVNTVLIVIQHGNSEIGMLQPIVEISAWCRERNILLHSDAVHTFGKVDLHSFAKSVDSFSISSHKFYGPKGIGLAYVNPALSWKPYFPGTTHENGFRPGTVNVPAIAAMTTVAQKITAKEKEMYDHAVQLRQTLLSHLDEIKDRITVFGTKDKHQLPHTLAMRIHGIEGQWAMLECNRRGFAISTGSACSTGLQEPSKTMTAMQIPAKTAKEMFRISFGRETKAEDCQQLAQTLIEIANSSS